MFSTIKSKIVIITSSILFFILITLLSSTYITYENSKELLVWSFSNSIEALVQNINKEVIHIENNARDLALLAEQYYYFAKSDDFLTSSVIKIFENYPDSLGGGIWFKPYSVFPNQMRTCIYAFRDKNKNIIVDRTFAGEDYDYLTQNWYKEITSEIKEENNIQWSQPYFEKQGSGQLMITAGSGIYDNNGKLLGISTVDWAISSILKTIQEIKPTPNSFALFANASKDYILISTDPYLKNKNLLGRSLKEIPWYNGKLKKTRYIIYHGKKFIPYVKVLDNGMIIIICVPKYELFYYLIKHLIIISSILFILSLLISQYLYYGLKKNILKPISKLTSIADRISHGETNLEIKVEKPEEFVKLASTFDKMTSDIKSITKEKEHISSELAIAKSIQESSLPDKFPPFPDRKEFDIYASMNAAKDVGGDFYDFYFIDENKFMFLIADVSGKGIPASLFMMTSKTLINNYSQLNLSPNELINQINNKICSTNKRGLFVTMFAGIIDLQTGKISCINCGHNPPLIKQNDNQYKYLNIDSNIVLGVFDDFEFSIYETQLNPGDIIFTYTDGVTEALNNKDELYGEERLLKCMNNQKQINDVFEIVDNVDIDVRKFTNGISQSDDLTMLCFRYNGCMGNSDKFKCRAVLDNYKEFYTWLHKKCSEYGLSEDLSNKIDMCAEELYANITFYAYPNNDNGEMNVLFTKEQDNLTLEFVDKGIAYNPLEKPDPDITLSADERIPGGLGIFMVKQMVDDIAYNRDDNQNILTLKFKI